MAELEIHLDLNRQGESQEAIPDSLKIVSNAGLTCVVNPDAWAASTVAYQLVRQHCDRTVIGAVELSFAG